MEMREIEIILILRFLRASYENQKKLILILTLTVRE